MKMTLATLVFLTTASAAIAQTAEITHGADREGRIGGSDTFTGTVYVQPVFDARMGNVSSGNVIFMPGARSHWHTHPVGQWLVVTDGTGWYQIRGEEKQVMRAGDVVWFPADLEHWHGATAGTSVTHLAILESVDGSAVAWGSPVSDAEFSE